MANSDFKREYSLRQDTPLIHFQHEQAGACLRASEVKPRLDRFIQDYLSRRSIKVPKSWYAAQSKMDSVKALAYKLNISCSAADTVFEKPHKLFFGNMGRSEQIMQITCKNVKISFFTFATKCIAPAQEKWRTLLELIDYVLPAFFALTCFGTRATKGFGSFSVDNGSELKEQYLLQFAPVYYTITYRGTPTGDAVLNDIWVISGMMKSGFNFTFRNPDDYYKGRIFRYFSEKGIGSDKAFIKQRVLTQGNDINKQSEERRTYHRFVFSRAMLGLAQQYTFRSGPKTTRQGMVKVTAATGNPVARFAAPVRFIPNGDILLILPTQIPEQMYNAKFQLNRETISTPSKEEFDLIAYLDWFCAEFNTKKEISDFENNDVNATIRKSLQIERHAQEKGGNANV